MNIRISSSLKNNLFSYKNNGQSVFISFDKSKSIPEITDVLIINQLNDDDEVKIITDNFGYTINRSEENLIGHIQQKIWKPGLTNNLEQFLDFTQFEKNIAKRDLADIIGNLQEILHYIEPSAEGLKSYSVKIRELIILACTEVEHYLRMYMNDIDGNYKTSDYIKILEKVALQKYSISFIDCITPYICKPFENWTLSQPTQSLKWYDAYNKVKHNKAQNYDKATLENCLNAVAAVIILFTIRYSPYCLNQESDRCSILIQNSIHLAIEGITISDLYIPLFKGEKTTSGAFSMSKHFNNGTEIRNIYDRIIIDSWYVD